MPLPPLVDIVIIGAGPAGLTTAALLKKYRPQTAVLVIEKSAFPRHKIGESLIVDVNRVLADMGATAAVEAAGFSRKYGATFIWGAEREPKTFVWSDGAPLAHTRDGYQLDYTFHVDRPAYDQILADCAAAHGAHVVHEHEVTGLCWEAGRAVGVRARDPSGTTHTIRARIVIDCAGGHGPMTREVAGRSDDKALRNIAVYGYYRDVAVVPEITGPSDQRRTTIVTSPRGWVWIIPLRGGVTSVGFVTNIDEYARSGVGDPRDYHRAMLQSLPEYDRLFRDARLVDYRGDGRMIHTVREYSYTCERVWGPGWATVGDASGFVDAILSIGCFVAQNHAQFLAYALASVLDGDCDEDLALSSFATTVQENLRAFRAVAHCFYAFNPDMTVWWRECSARLRESRTVPDGDDRAAFVAFFTGFATRQSSLYEDALDAFGPSFIVELSEKLFGEARPFPREHADAAEEYARRALADDAVLRFKHPYTLKPFALPARGGRLRPVVRLEISAPEGVAEEAVSRRIYLSPEDRDVPALLDGTRRLSDVLDTLTTTQGGGDREALRSNLHALIHRLATMGVLERCAAGDHPRDAAQTPPGAR